jgi:hypothetical protein
VAPLKLIDVLTQFIEHGSKYNSLAIILDLNVQEDLAIEDPTNPRNIIYRTCNFSSEANEYLLKKLPDLKGLEVLKIVRFAIQRFRDYTDDKSLPSLTLPEIHSVREIHFIECPISPRALKHIKYEFNKSDIIRNLSFDGNVCPKIPREQAQGSSYQDGFSDEENPVLLLNPRPLGRIGSMIRTRSMGRVDQHFVAPAPHAHGGPVAQVLGLGNNSVVRSAIDCSSPLATASGSSHGVLNSQARAGMPASMAALISLPISIEPISVPPTGLLKTMFGSLFCCTKRNNTPTNDNTPPGYNRI